MFRNHILMGVAHASNTRLLRQTAETAKFLAIIFLFLTENVSRTCCSSNTIGYKSNDGYASWVATQTTGVVSGTVAAATADDTHRLAKRMDLELCLSKYEIHKNTIIRTGESQTLGGKYLQGLELDTAEECQRLCCETESCDVYVFEDKSDGYCYLFECGPPENFHCKFTRHANYTSAVLTVARNVNEKTTAKPTVAVVKGTNSISQQEWELTSLKVKPEERNRIASTAVGASGVESAGSPVLVPGTATISGNANVVATAGPVPMLGVEQIPPISVAFPQKVYPVQCGRFQFPCHSGECIAVYNACDGIPQCEDGSDEGPECSGVTSTAKANADAGSTNALDSSGQKLPSETQYQPSLSQQTMQQQQQQQQWQQQRNPSTTALTSQASPTMTANVPQQQQQQPPYQPNQAIPPTFAAISMPFHTRNGNAPESRGTPLSITINSSSDSIELQQHNSGNNNKYMNKFEANDDYDTLSCCGKMPLAMIAYEDGSERAEVGVSASATAATLHCNKLITAATIEIPLENCLYEFDAARRCEVMHN
uniref:Low-density lipoprotein receptor-related protein 11 n=1 Tax=Ceratitis capitata TaxID=7213 RepID=W8B238_CERCA